VTSSTRTYGERFVFSLREFNGALGDLGTLLPLMLGAIAIAGLAPVPVLLGFALCYVASALYYRLPIPVQPMKAIVAVLLVAPLGAVELAIAGLLIGSVLLMLGASGWIGRIARLVPQSVLAGLQLGLGLALTGVALGLMASAPWLGALTLGVLIALLRIAQAPSVLIALGLAVAATPLLDAPVIAIAHDAPFALPLATWPELVQFERAASQFVLPQLALTFTNAIVLTALVAGDYFGDRAAHVTPARLSIGTGLANLALTPFGALPMCHGAGGLAAHHRFGARSGAAPLLLGLALLVLALLPDGRGIALLAAVPLAALGALLLMAAAELALSRRLFDSRPSCWPVIGITAGVTLASDPFLGLVAGSIAELARLALVRALIARKRRAR
jgi:hypothetical protein